MNYCIFRTKKLKTDGNIAGSVSHALRTRETPNADKDLTPGNWCNWKGSPEEQRARAMARYRELLPPKVRKNGVRAVELLMTASPEAMNSKSDDEKIAYLNDCMHWAEAVFGNENIFLKTTHFDETTPHLSILLVPIDDKGKLNCRYYLGGREKLSKLQDSFYEQVGKNHGLDRGEKGSKAKHKTIKKYYEELNELERTLPPPEKKPFEKYENFVERYTERIAPYFKLATQTERIKQQNETFKTIHKNALDKQKKAYQSEIAGLYEALQSKSKDIAFLKKELEKTAHRLNNWRKTTPAELREIADDLDANKSKNWQDFEKRRNQNRGFERD